MWLKKLVGIVMIITLLGMNSIVVIGLLNQPKAKPLSKEPAVIAVVPVPTVTLKTEPAQIPAMTTSALTWTSTGNPTECVASGSWQGSKTPFGAESTGRIVQPGNYTYTLTCKNPSGNATSSSTITVGNAIPPKNPVVNTSTPVSPSANQANYCSGRTPCYGPKDVAKHNHSGDCWGYNIDRVMNISGFDAAYHQAKSGLSSIEVDQVCGKNLGSALSGSVTVDSQSWNHKQSTKANADKNMAPYFVGYFDANK